MNQNTRIQIVQLKDGRKLMRIEDDVTGLAVECSLSPEHPFVAQKTKLLRLFEALLAIALLFVWSVKCSAQDEIIFRECFQKPPRPLFLWHNKMVFPEGKLSAERVRFQRLSGNIVIDELDSERKDRVWEVKLQPNQKAILKIDFSLPKDAKFIEIHYNLRSRMAAETDVFEVNDNFSFDGKDFGGHGGGNSGKEWRTWMIERDVKFENESALNRNRGQPIPASQLYTSDRDGKKGGVPALVRYSKIPDGARTARIEFSARSTAANSTLLFDDFVLCVLRSERASGTKIAGRGR